MIGPHRLPCETPEAHRPAADASSSTRWVLPATILGSSLSFIDGSVVNVALSAIRADLDASIGALQWVVNGYMLTLASFILLGGWLVDTVGWRWIFFINLPIGIAALVLAVKLPADRGTANTAPLDRRGSVLAVLALGALCYGLIALGEGAALRGLVAIAAALPLTWLLIRTEERAQPPMLPLALFENRDFAGANAVTALLYAALGGALSSCPSC